MKKYILLILVSVLVFGCKSNEESQNSTAVDLSDLLSIYKENGDGRDISDDDNLYKILYPFEDNDTSTSIDIEIYDSETFTYEFPETKMSQQPFLASAEDIFNSCLIANGIWSNFEVWDRFYGIEDKTIANSIRQIKLDCLKDETIRRAATTYRDGMADLLSRAEEAVDEDLSPYDLRESFIGKINEKWYKFYDDEEKFSSLMTQKYDSLSNIVEETYQLYLKTDEGSQLSFILNAMNKCKSFDEQCSLFFKWADSEESEDEDLWIIAVGTRLMDGEHYSPFLYKVWQIWRPLCQDMFFGLSRDSEIPNKLYNEYRARCYATCLKYIDIHSDDVLAMNCASVLAGQRNINRYGSYSFGNQSAIEKIELLPNRYKSIFNNEEEEEDSISDEL